VIVHRDELEMELARGPARFSANGSGQDYMIIGTVERKVWQAGLKGTGTQLDEIRDHMADFKKHFDLHYEPGGWRPAGEQ
jgi:hypothetical protein